MNPSPSSIRHSIGRRSFFHHSAFALAGLGCTTAALHAAGWQEMSALPALGTFGLEGSLPNLKGKVLYLDFWASWCSPCKASFPILNQWQQQFAARGFTVLGVSVDEKAADMQAFLNRTPASFPVVRDAAQKLVAAASIKTMPTSFLVNREGRIRHVHQGFRRQDEKALADQITALLGTA